MKKRALGGMSRVLFDSDLIASRLALFLAEAHKPKPLDTNYVNLL